MNTICRIASICKPSYNNTAVCQLRNLQIFSQSQNFSKRLTKIKPSIWCNIVRTSKTAAPETGLQSNPLNVRNKWVGRWLFGCSGMVFGAVVLGGVTRLTGSGLSMTDWHLFGKMPPLTREEWQKEFAQYQEFPEYKQTNRGMSLEEFKFIWWMEYGHRQWGRIIGGFFLIPASYFWYKGRFTAAMKKRVVVLGVLIGLQGLMGWYMVKSGLEDRFQDPNDVPRVSQYRLMSHLGAAFVLYSLFLWNALEQLFPAQTIKRVTTGAVRFRKLAHVTKGFVFLTAMSGALVAGLDAGLIYNTFPKMADRWIPSDILAFSPALRNFTENPTTAQFDHRVLAVTSLTLVTILLMLSKRRVPLPPRARVAASYLGLMAWLQVSLGIGTLLLHVPIELAAMHQSGSLLTLSAAIWLTHELKHLKRLPK